MHSCTSVHLRSCKVQRRNSVALETHACTPHTHTPHHPQNAPARSARATCACGCGCSRPWAPWTLTLSSSRCVCVLCVCSGQNTHVWALVCCVSYSIAARRAVLLRYAPVPAAQLPGHFQTHTHIPQHQTHTYHRTHKYATQANTQHTQHAQITPAGGSRTIVHMTANFAFFPRRTWRLPPTLLLPSRINFAGELRCCVRGDLQSGKVGVVACLQLCVRCALCAGPANSGL